MDAPLTIAIAGVRAIGSRKMKTQEGPVTLLYVNDFGAYRRGQKAMVQAHKSQMIWFRWGWICIGRYMIVNDLKREVIV